MFVVYKGHNSPFVVEIRHPDGSLFSEAEINAITRAKMKVNGQWADSDAHTGAFDLTTYAADGEISIDLGGIDLTDGTDNEAELIVYDATYDDGLVAGVYQIEIADDVESDGETAPAVNGAFNIMAASAVTADGGYSGFSENVTVGEAVSMYDILYQKSDDGKYYKAKASDSDTMPAVAMALAAADADATCLILTNGYIRNDAWAWTDEESDESSSFETPKDLYVSGSVAGALTETVVSTEGYWSQSPAWIYSTNMIRFHGEVGRAQYTA